MLFEKSARAPVRTRCQNCFQNMIHVNSYIARTSSTQSAGRRRSSMPIISLRVFARKRVRTEHEMSTKNHGTQVWSGMMDTSGGQTTMNLANRWVVLEMMLTGPHTRDSSEVWLPTRCLSHEPGISHYSNTRHILSLKARTSDQLLLASPTRSISLFLGTSVLLTRENVRCRPQAVRATAISRGPCSVALGRLCRKLGEVRQVCDRTVDVDRAGIFQVPVQSTVRSSDLAGVKNCRSATSSGSFQSQVDVM